MPSKPKPKKLVRKAATTALKKLASTALTRTAERARNSAERATETAKDFIHTQEDSRLPIQRAVDVAVPLRVAWDEWIALETIPEGTRVITDIERDGDQLIGQTSGPNQAEWSAEILGEREEQSFAWQSHEGSDCAGLITFHALSDRLTRIELNLELVPTNLAEALQITTRLADRRAERELRRFKARLELISPDQYEQAQQAEPESLNPKKSLNPKNPTTNRTLGSTSGPTSTSSSG